MLIQPCCYQCGEHLMDKEIIFLEGLEEGKSPAECFELFNTQWSTNERPVYSEFCSGCKRMLTSYMNIGLYLQLVEEVYALTA